MPRPALLLALAAVAAAAPASAEADSLAFVKHGEAWAANADGSSAHGVTRARNNWPWPSEADNGTVVAAGGAQRVNPDGSDSSGSSELYRMTQAGKALGSPMLTPGSTSTPQCPTYGPTDVRVSPGGDKIAYTDFFCDDFLSFTTPADATD